jgi:uncharacterized protein (TIGR02266 family)
MNPHAEPSKMGQPDVRRTARRTINVEVGVASHSNFYQGFTENLSNSGVFVATYAVQPIGAKVDIVLTFPKGEQIHLSGVVRWLREAAGEHWPGLGVQFESLSPEAEARVREFIRLREPLFYEHDD